MNSANNILYARSAWAGTMPFPKSLSLGTRRAMTSGEA